MADLIVYVDPDASGAGNGTSYADAYTSMSAAATAAAADYVTANDTIKYLQRSSAGTADGSYLISGSVTSPTNTITIETDSAEPTGRHNGKYSTAHYRNEYTITSGYRNLIRILDDYVNIIGAQAKMIGTAGTEGVVYRVDAGTNTSNVIADKCIFWQDATPASAYAGRFDHQQTILNSIFITSQHGMLFSGWDGAASTIFNTAVYGSGAVGTGVNASASHTVTIRNSAVFNFADDFAGAVTADYCASDDGDGTNAVTPVDWATVFVDHVNGDFDKLASDTDLTDTGTDTGAPITDIVGRARPQGASTDIGPFESIVAAVGAINVSMSGGMSEMTGGING